MKKKGVAFILIISLGMSSCALFRTKNKCNTCPSWSQSIEIKKTESHDYYDQKGERA